MDAEVVVGGDESPTDDDVRQVVDGLVDFNARHGPPGRFRRVATFVRDSDGRIRGGAVAMHKWNWLFISHVWIDEELRGRGLGTQVMETIEQLARSNGCTGMHLETLGFQAKEFYEGLGFREFGELANYAEGHGRHFMWKPLEAEA